MGYRDDFYCIQNVYGYSGDIHHFPTVYFVQETPTGKLYGHITQAHPGSTNVGRGRVDGPDPHYEAREEIRDGVRKLVEYNRHGEFHESRSTMTKRAQMSAADIVLCAQAIWQCTGEKYIDEYDDDTLNTMAVQAGRHAAITPAALMAQRQRIMAAGDARRRQARNQQLAQFNALLAGGDRARQKRGF
jgi:hypothetical protein